MATVSFDKSFAVRDPKAAQSFLVQLDRSAPLKVVVRDVKADSQRGILLLKKKLSK